MKDVWQKEILRHFRNPQGCCTEAHSGAEGFARNRRCGDEVRLVVKLSNDGTIETLCHRVSGCAITTATASLFSLELEGLSVAAARSRVASLIEMLNGQTETDLAETWIPLRMVQSLPARHSCVKVVAEALERAFLEAEKIVDG